MAKWGRKEYSKKWPRRRALSGHYGLPAARKWSLITCAFAWIGRDVADKPTFRGTANGRGKPETGVKRVGSIFSLLSDSGVAS
jgi:hypothetical protein